MLTPYGRLTYCSNIHPGEKWDDHFAALRQNLPYIKAQLSPDAAFGLGLRVANEASKELSDPIKLSEFKQWLDAEDIYVFAINGFPYGGFHNTVVKDHVHTPDWTTDERQRYTLRLFNLLATLLPDGIDGGVSTPPLSYQPWWKNDSEKLFATEKATKNLVSIIDSLLSLKKETGKTLHLDIEPEPDGILDNIDDFVKWYAGSLLPIGTNYLKSKYGREESQAQNTILTHFRLCYDICHAAVGFEKPEKILQDLTKFGIKVGRIQISSALKINLSENSYEKIKAIKAFNEPVYLHQVVAKKHEGIFEHFTDLPEALAAYCDTHEEWRVHFHVPLFVETYGLLDSTQSDILDTLKLHKTAPFSQILEVETYTWGVLPVDMQRPIADSIVRELKWVQKRLNDGLWG